MIQAEMRSGRSLFTRVGGCWNIKRGGVSVIGFVGGWVHVIILITMSRMRSVNLKKLGTNQIIVPSADMPSSYALRDLEKTIDPRNHLPHRSFCHCKMCLQGKGGLQNSESRGNNYSSGLQAKLMFKKIMDGLTNSGAKSLRLFVPDLFFMDGDCIQIYQNSKQDGRVTKLSGATPLKHLFPTQVRMRRQYKLLLQENYNRKNYEKVDPGFMHSKYYDKVVPSHFHAGIDSSLLQVNKNHFRRYVLHNNSQYEIPGIQEHKMNERQPFCLVVYRDGNIQLLNQMEMELYSLNSQAKIQQEVIYFQAYIKYKKETQSILYSEYNYNPQSIDLEIDQKAEKEVMILLGGLGKFDEGHTDLDSLQQISIELMLSQPKRYADLMTYKIVHYLAMASRMYVTHIKLKWIVNDLGTVYLQEVMECMTTEIPRRIIKYKLPRKDESLDFYSNQSNNFVQIYKDMKRRRVLNTLIIKKDINDKTYEAILEMMNPQIKTDYDEKRQKEESAHQSSLHSSRKANKVFHRLYNTIELPKRSPLFAIKPKKKQSKDASTYDEYLRVHPQIAMRNMRYDSASLNRYAPQRCERVDSKINNHFIYHMSSEDKKILSSQKNKQKKEKSEVSSSLEKYLEKRKQRVQKSLLYSTFHDLNVQKMREVNSLLNHQKISQKLQKSSAL